MKINELGYKAAQPFLGRQNRRPAKRSLRIFKKQKKQ